MAFSSDEPVKEKSLVGCVVCGDVVYWDELWKHLDTPECKQHATAECSNTETKSNKCAKAKVRCIYCDTVVIWYDLWFHQGIESECIRKETYDTKILEHMERKAKHAEWWERKKENYNQRAAARDLRYQQEQELICKEIKEEPEQEKDPNAYDPYEKVTCGRCGVTTTQCNMHHHKITIKCIKSGDPNDPEVQKDEARRLEVKKNKETREKNEFDLCFPKELTEKQKDNLIKVPCDLCGESISKRCLEQHRHSIKCKRNEASKTMVPCDRCGEIVAKTRMTAHKLSIKCKDAAVGVEPAESIEEPKDSHYERNKEEILKKSREKIPCDRCGAIVAKSGMSHHKKTHKCITSKDHVDPEDLKKAADMREQARAMYERHKETISKKSSEKAPCDRCGAVVVKRSMERHKRSNKCMSFKPVEQQT